MNDRILHIALKGVDGENQEGLCRALRGMGNYFEIDWRKANLLQNCQLLYAAMADIKPTIVIMQLQTAGVITPEQITAARAISPDTIFIQWNGDLREQTHHLSMAWQVALGRVCDLTLVTNLDDVAWFYAQGISSDYWQIGYDWTIYKPKIRDDQLPAHKNAPICATTVPSVVFLGSNYPHLGYESSLRLDLAAALYEALEGDFACYGHQWTGYPWGMPRVDAATEALIYQNCKAAVVLSLRSDVACYTSDRLFRATGCGALALVKRFAGMEKLFYDSGCCVLWETVEELVKLAQFWIQPAQDNWRRAIAENGAMIAQLHSWTQRAAELRQIIDRYRMPWAQRASVEALWK